MGYRSDVAVAAPKEVMEEWLAAFPALRSCAENFAELDDGKVLAAEWNWVKWGDGELLWFCENNKPYAFGRIGEDMEDNEWCGNDSDTFESWKYCNVVRTIRLE